LEVSKGSKRSFLVVLGVVFGPGGVKKVIFWVRGVKKVIFKVQGLKKVVFRCQGVQECHFWSFWRSLRGPGRSVLGVFGGVLEEGSWRGPEGGVQGECP
jgi:hypothetical protein